MRLFRRLALVPLLALFGCATPPPPPPPTVVNITLTATPDINPDDRGHAAPVSVKIYQLATTGNFSKLDFFQLYGKEQAALGADLAGEDQATLTPGQSQSLSVTLKPNAKALGILVAYRNIDHAQWRATSEPPPNKTSTLAVTVGKLAVKAEAGK